MLSSLLCPAMPWNTDVLNLLLAGGHLPLTFAVPYIQGRTAINCGSGSLCSDVGSKHIGRLHVHSRICNPYYNDPSARMQPPVVAFFFTWSLRNRAAPGSLRLVSSARAATMPRCSPALICPILPIQLPQNAVSQKKRGCLPRAGIPRY